MQSNLSRISDLFFCCHHIAQEGFCQPQAISCAHFTGRQNRWALLCLLPFFPLILMVPAMSFGCKLSYCTSTGREVLKSEVNVWWLFFFNFLRRWQAARLLFLAIVFPSTSFGNMLKYGVSLKRLGIFIHIYLSEDRSPFIPCNGHNVLKKTNKK